MKVDEVLEAIKSLKIMEVSELVKKMEETFGVSAAAPVAAAAAAPAAAAEEKTQFNVVLKSAGAQKIQVIKAVRSIVSSLGLKEAKELVEGTDSAVLEGASKEEAEKAKATLEGAGATVQIV